MEENKSETTLVPPVKITSLAELEAICDKPFTCTIPIGSQDIEIPCRRLTPAESAEIEIILSEALPPLVQVGDLSDPRRDKSKDYYDMQDQSYLKRRACLEREARALVVYLGCPLYKQQKPDLKDRKEIRAFVESKFTETVLQLLYNAIAGGGVGLEARVNFS